MANPPLAVPAGLKRLNPRWTFPRFKSAPKKQDEPADGSSVEKSDIFSGDRKRSDSRRRNKRAFEASQPFYLFLPLEAVRRPSLLTGGFLIYKKTGSEVRPAVPPSLSETMTPPPGPLTSKRLFPAGSSYVCTCALRVLKRRLGRRGAAPIKQGGHFAPLGPTEGGAAWGGWDWGGIRAVSQQDPLGWIACL